MEVRVRDGREALERWRRAFDLITSRFESAWSSIQKASEAMAELNRIIDMARESLITKVAISELSLASARLIADEAAAAYRLVTDRGSSEDDVRAAEEFLSNARSSVIEAEEAYASSVIEAEEAYASLNAIVEQILAEEA